MSPRMQRHWEAWAHEAIVTAQAAEKGEDRIAVTGIPLMALLFPIPTLMHLATAGFAFSISQLPWAAGLVMSRMIAAPMSILISGVVSPRAKTFVERVVGSSSSSTPAIPTSAVLVLLASVASLFLEYVGRQAMKKETPKTQVALEPTLNPLTNMYKGWVHAQYTHRTAYYNEGAAFSLSEGGSPVRIVYNVLVGLNCSVFYMLGGKSADPSTELIHWGAILFYWEVLVHLLHLYGWGPVSSAVHMLLHRLLRR